MTCPVRPRWYPRFRRRGAGGGRWGGRPCRTANVIVGRGASGRCARRAGNGKPGSGTGARFAPTATTRSASSATAPRSIAHGRAGSGSGRPRPSSGRRFRRRNPLAAACWTCDGSRIGSGCSRTCSARLQSRRDRSPLAGSGRGACPYTAVPASRRKGATLAGGNSASLTADLKTDSGPPEGGHYRDHPAASLLRDDGRMAPGTGGAVRRPDPRQPSTQASCGL